MDPSPVPSLNVRRGTPTKLSTTPIRGNSLRSSISEKERVEHVDATSAIEGARQRVSFIFGQR
jgi:hypothetical protein